jgi:hypothetical protein
MVFVIRVVLLVSLGIASLLMTSCQGNPAHSSSQALHGTKPSGDLRAFIAHMDPSDQYSVKCVASNIDFPLYRSSVPLVAQSDLISATKHPAMENHVMVDFGLTPAAQKKYRDMASELADNFILWMDGDKVWTATMVHGIVSRPALLYDPNGPHAAKIDEIVDQINSEK